MSVQVEKLEKGMAKLTIEVSAEEFEKAVNTVYQKQRNRIQIPGFRKGKAPRKMIENMYGAGIFYEDAANEIIPDAYEKAYDECGEEITSSPEIDVEQIESGKPFIFTAVVALKPEVKLGEYKGVAIDNFSAEVTEEEVNAEIDRERDNSARMVSVEDRPVQDGDMTELDFEGFVDGEAFEGGKGENYPLTIGSGAFIPGFEEQLIGAELNKEVEVNVTFPEDYNAEHLAGKDAVFKCTVKEIKVKELPELDDEFASEVSEYDTLEEYRANVRKGLEERKAKQMKDEKEDAAIAAVVEHAEMEIPDAMLATEQRQMLDQFAQRITMQGMQMEQYMQMTGNTREMMLEQLKPQAERKIKSRLCMEAVAKAENITASEEDYEEEMKVMADAYQIEVDKVKEMLGEKEKKSVMEDIAVRKAIEFVAENAVVKEKEEKTEE
ncbi:MAG: trigger factor [Lachnospiraceae bacterium]|jgi:trigger factor|nr:trigger factor [Lachnospiraceae bacterium]